MIKTLIDREVARLKKQGYDAIIETDAVTIAEQEKTISLGDDTAIITAVTFDEDMAQFDKLRLTITSATDCISGSMKDVASSATSIYKIMRQYLIISRESDSATDMTVHFIRIIPKQIV